MYTNANPCPRFGNYAASINPNIMCGHLKDVREGCSQKEACITRKRTIEKRDREDKKLKEKKV